MKRAELIRHLERQGCQFLGQGGSHTVYMNRAQRKVSTIPCHRELNDLLAL